VRLPGRETHANVPGLRLVTLGDVSDLPASVPPRVARIVLDGGDLRWTFFTLITVTGEDVPGIAQGTLTVNGCPGRSGRHPLARAVRMTFSTSEGRTGCPSGDPITLSSRGDGIRATRTDPGVSPSSTAKVRRPRLQHGHEGLRRTIHR